MSYIRVIPRDLFNEASLLKCYGQLYIALETAGQHAAQFDVEDVDFFDIRQSEDDGSTTIANVPFSVAGRSYHLSRPLNSRAPWPLWISDLDDPDFEPFEVFDDAGKLSVAMCELIRAKARRAEHTEG